MSAIKLPELYAIVDEAMKSERNVFIDDKRKKEELSKLHKIEQDLKLLSTDGSKEAREYTRNKIVFILGDMKNVINPDDIDEIISLYHIDYFKNIYSDDTYGYTNK